MDETKALPLISIIVPVYNVKDYVEKCLDSICGQSYTNLEIVVVLSLIHIFADSDNANGHF